MREAIRQALIAGVPQVEGRVFEPHAVPDGTPAPYLVVVESAATAGPPWSAPETVLEVWPYAARTTYRQVDELAGAVIATLHWAHLEDQGRIFLVEFEGAGEDVLDETWGITRALRFRCIDLGWLSGRTYDPDPVAALADWITARWPQVQTDPAVWRPSDQAPGVYWRLVSLRVDRRQPRVTYLRARWRGHVVAPSPAVRALWARMIAEALSVGPDPRMAGGPVLQVEDVQLDLDRDQFTEGQLLLEAVYPVFEEPAPVEPLRRVEVKGDVTFTIQR